jgi:glycosyltransferase involved in cell wall biosynthesis
MRVCIARNAEARTNAAIARIANALNYGGHDLCLLTRNRFINGCGRVRKSKYNLMNKEITNYEIIIKSEPGSGFINIFQLLLYQCLVFIWFIVNRDKYDIIHAFDLDVGLPASIACVLTKKRYVYHIADFYVDSHDIIPKVFKQIIRRIEYSVINRAVTTVICTEKRAEQIAGSKPNNLVVVHNTPSISRELINIYIEEKKKKEESKKEFIFTYVGALSENRFIRIAIDVIKRYPMITLNLAGMGVLSDYAKEAAEKCPNINYYGIIDYNKALRLYSKTDFMFAVYDPTVPNHKYCAPNKVYEAMALGNPIIVARGTGIDRIVSENKIGVVIEYSEEAFEKMILKIIEGKLDIKSLSHNSRNAYNKYSWEEMKKRIANIYNDLESAAAI